MDNFDKFQSYLLKEIRVITEPMVKQHMQELGEAIWNDMFNLKGKKVLDRKLSEKEVFLSKVFYGYIEISDSYANLNDIEVYIGRFPYRNTSVSKERCLRYHIVNYMNEIYVLRERLSAYLTRIGRLYRQDARHQKVLESTKSTFKIVSDVLSGIVKSRGIHVHKSSYKDEMLERLNLLNSFTRYAANDVVFADSIAAELRRYYGLEYRKLGQKWRRIIKKDNKAIRELLNIYFGSLLRVLFDRNGNLIYPRTG
jgi:hypothetical protein